MQLSGGRHVDGRRADLRDEHIGGSSVGRSRLPDRDQGVRSRRGGDRAVDDADGGAGNRPDLIAHGDIGHPHAGPPLLVAGMDGYPLAGAGQPHHNSFGQCVLRGDMHPTELPRVVERQHQPVTGIDLAQQHTRGPDWDDQRFGQNAAANTRQPGRGSAEIRGDCACLLSWQYPQHDARRSRRRLCATHGHRGGDAAVAE